jgi:DNA-binding MarR family transcriptional regulator
MATASSSPSLQKWWDTRAGIVIASPGPRRRSRPSTTKRSVPERLFQTELFERLVAAGLTEARRPHTHVTAYVKAEGSRLTELAAQARMTLPAMSELVDDLQRLGIVERRPDPRDRRAKLICLTEAGWTAMRTARRVIAEIEADYARRVGPERFEFAAQTLDALLRALASDTGDAHA